MCHGSEALSDHLRPAEPGRLQRLRTLDAKQILDNQWALRSTYTAAELKDIVRRLMDERDRIVVAEIGAEWASRRALVNLAKI